MVTGWCWVCSTRHQKPHVARRPASTRQFVCVTTAHKANSLVQRTFPGTLLLETLADLHAKGGPIEQVTHVIRFPPGGVCFKQTGGPNSGLFVDDTAVREEGIEVILFSTVGFPFTEDHIRVGQPLVLPGEAAPNKPAEDATGLGFQALPAVGIFAAFIG